MKPDVIREQLLTLADLRAARAAVNESIASETAYYEALLADKHDEQKRLTVLMLDLEIAVRGAALDEYATTKNKAPFPGLGIRVTTDYVYDPAIALAWAQSHQIALLLDKKAFERIASGTKLDFVEIKDVPQATIAADIYKAIGE